MIRETGFLMIGDESAGKNGKCGSRVKNCIVICSCVKQSEICDLQKKMLSFESVPSTMEMMIIVISPVLLAPRNKLLNYSNLYIVN